MKDILSAQRSFFDSNETKTVTFRKESLQKLKSTILKHEDEIYTALMLDLNKSAPEGFLTEVQMVLSEIELAIKKLHSWQKPKRAKTPFFLFPAKSRIYHEPFGIALIMSPWNYPFQLSLSPLVGAIAGGNCAILKASKSSENTSKIVKKIIDEAFEKKYIFALCDEYSYDEILAEKYDIIFFTGSQRVGKIVMEAASRHLTPIILELGGKSPCIVEKTADPYIAAKRIVWGKFLNSGQTCVAPDYVLVDKAIEHELLDIIKLEITRLYKIPLENPDYPKIINRHHFERLKTHILNHKTKYGGLFDENTMQIEPTLFLNCDFSSPIMEEEIFGPILPIIAYDNLSEIVSLIKKHPVPLALYMFTKDKAMADAVINSVSFGSGCINDTVMQVANHHIPFGGVGESGMGCYHGKYNFDAFTREKGMLIAKNYLDIPLRYPPYTKKKFSWLKKLMK